MGKWPGDRRRFALTLAAAVFVAGCGGESRDVGTTAPPIPGLAPVAEVSLTSTDPDPSDERFEWSTAYLAGDLPKVNVGHPNAQFMADAAREDDPDSLICLGDSSGSGGCDELESTEPGISGLTFGGPDVRAWAWLNVPDTAAAVVFTDQDGVTTWQRPADEITRLVIFPDTSANDTEGDCPCRLDAVDEDGTVIASVDLQTLAYVDG